MAACLLHDFGHLVAERDEAAGKCDDVNQFIAQPFPRGLFPETVLARVRRAH